MGDPYELSVRKRAWGTGIAPVQPKWPGGSDPAHQGHSRLTFFIHGYNNVLASAEKVWRETFRLLLNDGVPSSRFGEVVLLYWPGDVAKSQIVSAPFYPLLIKAANAAADELASYLKQLPSGPSGQRMRLQFIGHSLGCRVVLETLKKLNDRKRYNFVIEDVLLMAAAVPTGYCAGKNAPYKAWPGIRTEMALHSSRDSILKLFFVPGQALALDMPKVGLSAVGSTGGPFGRWRPACRDTGLRHGQYWTSVVSVARIAELLKPARGSDHRIATYQPPKRSVHVEGWRIAQRRIVPRSI